MWVDNGEFSLSCELNDWKNVNDHSICRLKRDIAYIIRIVIVSPFHPSSGVFDQWTVWLLLAPRECLLRRSTYSNFNTHQVNGGMNGLTTVVSGSLLNNSSNEIVQILRPSVSPTSGSRFDGSSSSPSSAGLNQLFISAFLLVSSCVSQKAMKRRGMKNIVRMTRRLILAYVFSLTKGLESY